MSQRIPELREAISTEITRVLLDLHTCAPGFINSYQNGIATAQPSIKRKFYRDTEYVDLPSIVEAPVFVYGGAGFTIEVTPQVGDPCLILFSERSLENWTKGSATSTVEPGDRRRHHISDGMILPLQSRSNTSPTVRIQITATGDVNITGTAQVNIDAPQVNLGDTPLENVVTDTRLNTFLQTLFGAAVVVPNDGGAAFKANLVSILQGVGNTLPAPVPVPPLPSPGSVKVRAE